MKKIIVSIKLIIITISFSFAQDEFTLVKEGDMVPDFAFEVERGVTKKISELNGKIVWINFFATWCGPCLLELPHLEKEVFERFKDHTDFEVMVIGREHTWEEVTQFKNDNNYKLPFYPDVERKIFSQFANQNIPRNFIIDKNGHIAIASMGFNEQDFYELVEKVEKMLD